MQNEFKKGIGVRETNWEIIVVIQVREEDVWLRTGAEGTEENRQIEEVSWRIRRTDDCIEEVGLKPGRFQYCVAVTNRPLCVCVCVHTRVPVCVCVSNSVVSNSLQSHGL